MRNVYHASLILIVCFPFAVNGQSLRPLPTEFVDCLTNQLGVPVASNRRQTSLFESKVGIAAYAEIEAKASTPAHCQNSTTVYVGKSKGSFRPVLRQDVERLPDGSVYDGNGVPYLSWSPSGATLLVVLFQWTYGTDSGGNYKYFLIEKEHNSAKLILPERAIWKMFKGPCSALINFNGWIDNRRIGLEVRPFVATDEEGKPDTIPACVKETTTFSFDVLTMAASGAFPVGVDNSGG